MRAESNGSRSCSKASPWYADLARRDERATLAVRYCRNASGGAYAFGAAASGRQRLKDPPVTTGIRPFGSSTSNSRTFFSLVAFKSPCIRRNAHPCLASSKRGLFFICRKTSAEVALGIRGKAAEEDQ